MDTPKKPTLAQYLTALQSHDWWFDYSDDHGVWMRGQREHTAILEMARVIDPDLTLYRQHMPENL